MSIQVKVTTSHFTHEEGNVYLAVDLPNPWRAETLHRELEDFKNHIIETYLLPIPEKKEASPIINEIP